ncbi:hypothetical protein HZB02_04290 [Candidatus Woesearchaeota archaeon]|nr:hypothetical protein [Candidatus Woesearchaeota archaeon]
MTKLLVEDDYTEFGDTPTPPRVIHPLPIIIPASPPLGSTAFNLEAIADGWRLSSVQMHDGIYTFEIANTRLPAKTQDQFAADAQANPTDYRACDGPEFYGIVATLFQNQTDPAIAPLYTFLNDSTAKDQPYLTTLTRVIWNPSGDDEVIHQFGLPTQYSLRGNYVCLDGNITMPATDAMTYVQAAFNTQDPMQRVDDTFKWLTGKNAYAYRFNKKVSAVQERALRVGVDDDYSFGVGAGDGISIDRSAFGVKVVAKNGEGL